MSKSGRTVSIDCAYRDTTREQLVPFNGITLSFGVPGRAVAFGKTREEATAKLTTAGFGTKQKPCTEVHVFGPDQGSWEASGEAKH